MNRYDDIMLKLGAEYLRHPEKEAIHLTEDEIRRAQSEIACRFPENYREFLRDYGNWLAPYNT